MATGRSKSKLLTVKSKTVDDIFVSKDSNVLHEGWAVKESGSAMFGRTNWRKRWFKLVQRSSTVYLEYYKSQKDTVPAGSVKLNPTYCTRPLESHEKPHPHCFAVGPMLDDGATRTYYISCGERLVMREWMAVIDAAIMGAPDQIKRRKETISKAFATKYKDKLKNIRERALSDRLEEDTVIGRRRIESVPSDIGYETSGLEESTTTVIEESMSASTMIPERLSREDVSDEELIEELEEDEDYDDDVEGGGGLEESTAQSPRPNLSPSRRVSIDTGLSDEEKRANYYNPVWRMRQWQALCSTLRAIRWSKSDTKDGITVARAKFGRGNKGHAVMKVEGVLAATPRTVFQFLQLSTRQGGKLDYMFRNEQIVNLISEEPQAAIVYNEFQPPLPRVSIRDLVAMRIWVPEGMSVDNKIGMAMFSVDHPDVSLPEKGHTRISINSSGVILQPCPGPGGAVHTKMTVLAQVGFFGAMHKMLKGAYNSGLLKIGFRTTFSLVNEQLERFIKITDI